MGDHFRIVHGNSLDVLAELPAASVQVFDLDGDTEEKDAAQRLLAEADRVERQAATAKEGA